MVKIVLPIIIIYSIYSLDGKNDEKNAEKGKSTPEQFSEQIGQIHSSQSNVAESNSHNLANLSPQRRQNDEYSNLLHNIEEQKQQKKRPREPEGQQQQNWNRLERIWSLERKRKKLEEELLRLIQNDPPNHQNNEENIQQQPESSNIIPADELAKRAEKLLDLDENDELPQGHEHLPPNNEQQNLPYFDRKGKGRLLDQSEIGEMANPSANVPPHHSAVPAQPQNSSRQKEQQKILRTFLQHHGKLHEQQKIQSSILDQQIQEQVKLLALYQQQIQQIHRQQQPQHRLMERGNRIEHRHQIHASNSIAAEHHSSVRSLHSGPPIANSNVQQEPSSARQIGEKISNSNSDKSTADDRLKKSK